MPETLSFTTGERYANQAPTHALNVGHLMTKNCRNRTTPFQAPSPEYVNPSSSSEYFIENSGQFVRYVMDIRRESFSVLVCLYVKMS